MTDILRAHAAEYLRQRGPRAGLHERSTLAQLTACRTAALGSHAWACDTCGATEVAYNSCRNRFCPQCGGAKRAQWLDKLAESLLPVPHFHLVFTVPHDLSRLILANRRELYDLLFHAAWETLRDVAADPKHLGADVGAVLVLHTWGQALDHHPHVHAVVPGGGLSLDGTRWLASRTPTFFLPVRVLSAVFRGKFLAGLAALRAAGALQLAGKLSPLDTAGGWDQFVAELRSRDWVVFSQPPPPAVTSAAPADTTPLLKYLARYVSGAAISNARLLAHADGHVTFRAKNYRQGRKRMTLRLSGVEFTRRFALHILPRGLQRVRRYGLLANRSTAATRCRALLPTAPPPAPPTVAPARLDDFASAPRCPHCPAGHLVLVIQVPRPRLFDVLFASGLLPEQLAARHATSTLNPDTS